MASTAMYRSALAFAATPAGFLLVGIAILFLRSPTLISHATFWGEDGWVWFPCAYARGLVCLTELQDGYLQTFPRLIAWIAQALPLSEAPRFFVAVAAVVQIAPAVFLVSDRMAAAIPSKNVRLILAFFLLCMPANYESFANITNSQWHLSILTFLILVSTAPATRFGRCLEAAILLLNGLSGPFTLLLLPIAFLQFWYRRDSWSGLRLGILGLTSAVQVVGILLTAGSRVPTPLGASVPQFLTIFGRQVVFAGVLGLRATTLLLGLERAIGSELPSMLLGGAGLVMVALAFRYGTLALRLFLIFATAILATGLASPKVSPTELQWDVIARPYAGARYFLIPIIAWFAVLLSLALRAPLLPRAMAAGLLGMTLLGIGGDWRNMLVHRAEAKQFRLETQAFATAPAGTRMEFTMRPPGTFMVLVKRPD